LLVLSGPHYTHQFSGLLRESEEKGPERGINHLVEQEKKHGSAGRAVG